MGSLGLDTGSRKSPAAPASREAPEGGWIGQRSRLSYSQRHSTCIIVHWKKKKANMAEMVELQKAECAKMHNY